MAVGRLARSPGHRPMPGNGVSPGEVGGRKPTRTQGRERCLQHIDDARHRCLHPGRSRLAGDSSPTAAHLPAVPVIENWLTAGNRDSRMRSRSGGRATGVVIVRVPHLNTPTSGGKNPHNSSRARSNTSLVYTSRSAARSCYGVGRAYRCGTLSSPHAGEPRSLHVSSAPVGADRGLAAPRDDPRCDPPSHLVDHRERPAGRNRLRSARHREW
jgi:hypothetical protein